MIDSRELVDDHGIWRQASYYSGKLSIIFRWLKMLNLHGMCLLTNVPCTEEGGFKVNPL